MAIVSDLCVDLRRISCEVNIITRGDRCDAISGTSQDLAVSTMADRYPIRVNLCFVCNIAAVALPVDPHLTDLSYRKASHRGPTRASMGYEPFEWTYLAAPRYTMSKTVVATSLHCLDVGRSRALPPTESGHK